MGNKNDSNCTFRLSNRGEIKVITSFEVSFKSSFDLEKVRLCFKIGLFFDYSQNIIEDEIFKILYYFFLLEKYKNLYVWLKEI